MKSDISGCKYVENFVSYTYKKTLENAGVAHPFKTGKCSLLVRHPKVLNVFS